MYKQALLASAVVGLLAVSATPLFSVAAERNCLTSYEKRYMPECGGEEQRKDVYERALDKHDVHPFYGSNDSIKDSYEEGIGQFSGEAEGPEVEPGSEIGMSEATIENSPTIIAMQSDIESNRTDIDANSQSITENTILLNETEQRVSLNENDIQMLNARIDELSQTSSGSGSPDKFITQYMGPYSSYYVTSTRNVSYSYLTPSGNFQTNSRTVQGQAYMCDVFAVYSISGTSDGTYSSSNKTFVEIFTIQRGNYPATHILSGTNIGFLPVLDADQYKDATLSQSDRQIILRHTSPDETANYAGGGIYNGRGTLEFSGLDGAPSASCPQQS